MAALTAKLSILTILRNNSGMWTVYQTSDMCLREYDLCNKFADNKMLLLLFKKMLNTASCSETAMLRSEMVGHSIDLCSVWREKSSVPFNKFQEIRRLLSDKKRCRKSGKKGKGVKGGKTHNQCIAMRGRLATELARENSSNGKYHSNQKKK